MDEHTPGPWHVTLVTKVTAAKAKRHGGGKAVCTCLPANRTDAAIREARANARLMAAAPDMLDALRDAQEALDGTFLTGAAREALRLVNAAIEKATSA